MSRFSRLLSLIIDPGSPLPADIPRLSDVAPISSGLSSSLLDTYDRLFRNHPISSISPPAPQNREDETAEILLSVHTPGVEPFSIYGYRDTHIVASRRLFASSGLTDDIIQTNDRISSLRRDIDSLAKRQASRKIRDFVCVATVLSSLWYSGLFKAIAITIGSFFACGIIGIFLLALVVD